MKNIFLQDAKFGDDSPCINVPKDTAQLSFFLQQQLMSKFPSLYGRALEVKFNSQGQGQDGNTHGVIAVKLSDRREKDGEKNINFPFIIKDFMMYPLDTFEYGDKFFKATEDNIASCLSSEAINFATPAPTPQRAGLIDTASTGSSGMEIMDPSNVFAGKTVMAAETAKQVEKVAAMQSYLDLISKSLPQFAVKLANYPGAFRGFQNFIKQAKAYVVGFSPKTVVLCKSASLKYAPDTCNYTFDYTYLNPTTSKIELATKTAGALKEIVTEMEDITDGGSLVDKMKSDNEAVDAAEVDNEAQILNLTNTTDTKINPEQSYVLYSGAGKPFVGAVIPNVVDFDLNVLPSQLFIGTEPIGTYAFDEKLNIREVPGKTPDWSALITPIEQNMTVSFMIPGPNSNKPVAATFPFKVLSVKSVDGEVAYVGKFLLRNNLITLIPTESVKTPMRVNPADVGEYGPLVDMTSEIFLVPKNLNAVSLDSAVDTVTIKEGERRFISNQLLRNREKVAEVVPWGKDDYKVIHPDIAFDGKGKLAMAALGALHLDKVIREELVKSARKLTVLLPNYSKPNFKVNTKIAKRQYVDRETLIKVASGINDENLAMLSLSLGLLDTDDGMRFGEYISTFQDTIDKLIKLLLASRMGMPISESASLKLGIDTLDSVIQQLRTL